MRTLKIVRGNSGGDLLADLLAARQRAARMKVGMRITMNDGWSGVIRSVKGDFVDCDEDGPNPHMTGRLIRREFLKVDDGNKVVADWKLATSHYGDARRSTSTVNRKRQSANVIDIERARLCREWQSAPGN